MSPLPYPLTTPTFLDFQGPRPTVVSGSQFCRRASDAQATLLVLGDIFSLFGKSFSGPTDPETLPFLFENLKKESKKTWLNLQGQCSCIWIDKKSIELFRSAFSPHTLFYSQQGVSDQLRMLTGSTLEFSDEYTTSFILDLPSLQFSSHLTPLKNVFRLPPAAIVSLKENSEPSVQLIPQEPYELNESQLTLHEASEELKETLKQILKWHLAKGKPVSAELSGGLDSSFVASYLSDLSPDPIEALMYAYRKHPSHAFSEECAKTVAREKHIQLQVFDSSEIAPPHLAEPGPYQNEPVDFFWQGTLFGPVCRNFVKPNSLLFTGFGCDQVLMRSNQIIRILNRKKGALATLPTVRELAQSLNRPGRNFTFQFFISQLPQTFLIRSLDLTRGLRVNPFKIDELLPEITKTERVSWFLEKGKSLSAVSLYHLIQNNELLEHRFFEPDLPHSHLNYLVAPQYVIQPYIESKGVQYIHPFCDSRMIDFAFKNIPYHLIHDFSHPYKHLVREAMRGITPESVRTRKRDEFSFDGYFFSFLKTNEDFLRELVENAGKEFSDWIDRKALAQSLESLFFGLATNSEIKLSRLISYLVWRKNFKAVCT
ncbi:MAG: hypothetical protein EBQ92_07985 [Proteobacteria bacterium]|nr:hypothetical protein [Pseudomonadota bacterium]